MVHLELKDNPPPKKTKLDEVPKVPQPPAKVDGNNSVNRKTETALQDELAEQNKETIAKATSMLQKFPNDDHRQAVIQWNLKRRERKQLEKDLLQYQVNVASRKSPTDQKIEQARMYIIDEHTKKLREELPYINRYFETIPADMDIEDNNGLLESSTGSYEAREEWNEEDY